MALPLLFFELLFFLSLVAIIGDMLRRLLREMHLTWLMDIDGPQKMALDIALGGLFLYLFALALTPLHLFTREMLGAITLLSILFQIYWRRKGLRQLFKANFDMSLNLSSGEKRSEIGVLMVVLAIFAVSLFYQLIPLQNLVLGSVYDNALHSLFVQLILENHGIPATHLPYFPAAVKFPQGEHVLFAYAVHLLGYRPEKAVLYVTALFNASATFGGYYFGKSFYNEKLGIALAFTLGLVALFPSAITWGGNTMAFGIFLWLVIMGMFYRYFWSKEEKSLKEFYVSVGLIGFLLGYLGTVHIAVFVLALTSMVLISAAAIAVGTNRLKFTKTVLKRISLIVLFSFVPLSVWMYRYFFLPQVFPENVDYSFMFIEKVIERSSSLGEHFPANIVFNPFRHLSIYQNIAAWYTESQYPLSDLFLTLSALYPFFLISSFYVDRKRFRSMVLVSIPFVSVFFWALNTPQGLFFLTAEPFLQMTAEADKILVFLTTILSIFASYTLVCSYDFFSQVLNKILLPFEKRVTTSLKKVMSYVPMVALVAIVLLSLPARCSTLEGYYRVHAVTTENDYELMLWMDNNLPKSAIVLVSQLDTGSYIPSIAKLKTIYAYAGSPPSREIYERYKILCSLIEKSDLNNSQLIELLKEYRINYIFIGEGVSSELPGTKWNPNAFIGNSNFDLTKKVGNAYLFKFLSSSS